MERGYAFRPLEGNLRIKNKCQVLARPAGEKFWRLLGDHSGVNLSYTIEETEVYSNETPDKDLAVLDITKAEPTLTMNLRQITDFCAQVMFLTGKPNAVAPAPVVDRKVKWIGMVAGDVADIGVQGITKIVATPNTLVEGTHYQVDKEAGRFEVIALPDAFPTADGIEVTVSGSGTGLPTYGMMDKVQIRSGILIRTNNRHGRNWEVELWDVQLRPDGDLAMGSDGDDFGELTVNGRLFADASQPAAYRFGRIRELPRRAA